MKSSSDDDVKISRKDNLVIPKREKSDYIKSKDRKKKHKSKTKSQPQNNKETQQKSKQNESLNSRDTFKDFKHKTSAKEYFNKKSNLVLISENSALKPVLTENDVNSDDEIFLVQCAQHVEMEALVGKKIKLNKQTKITVDDDNEYLCTFSLNMKDQQIALISSESVSRSAISLPLHGFININKIFEENLEIAPDALSNTHQNSVAYPTNIKTRHPLHGINYEKFIDLPANIRSKLKQASEDSQMDIELDSTKRKLVQLKTEEVDNQELKSQKKKRKTAKITAAVKDETMKMKEELPELSDLDWLSQI